MRKFLQIFVYSFLMGIFFISAGNASAATYNVTNTSNSGSGSLRQAIIDANASGSSDTINFNIDPLGPGCNGSWCTIQLSGGSIDITGNRLNINGYTQAANRGDTNPGQVGTGGTVGVDGTVLPQYDKPEIQINARNNNNVFNVDANRVTIRGLAIFNTDGSGGAINVTAGKSNFLIEQNLIGFNANGGDPGTRRNETSGISVHEGPTTGTIRNNYIGYNGMYGIDLGDTAIKANENIRATVSGNEIFRNGWDRPWGDNICVYSDRATIKENLIYRPLRGSGTNPRRYGGGIELRNGASRNSISNNTIRRSLTHGIIADTSSRRNTINKNIIRNTLGGPGIVISDYGDITGEGRSNRNEITENSIFNNNGLGIDLCIGCSDTDNGDGVTANTGSYNNSGANRTIDFPVITTSTLVGNILTISGYIGTAPSEGVFVDDTIEFYKSSFNGTDDPNPGVSDSTPYHGEGQTHLFDITSDADGNFSSTIDASSLDLNPGDYITATTTDGSGNTSEFSENKIVYEETSDLKVTKTVSDSYPNVGEQITFNISVINNGPDNASNVALKDVLPTNISLVSSTVDQGSYDSGSGIWTIGTINNGDTKTLTLTATVDDFGTLTNEAEITAVDQRDPNPGDEKDSATISTQSADLAVVKTSSNDEPKKNDEITFSVNLSNNGPDTATGVTLTEILPSGVEFSSSTADQGEYNASSGIWTVGTVAANSSLNLSIIVEIVATGKISNTAQVRTSDQYDPIISNNSSTITLDVSPDIEGEIVFEKSSDPSEEVVLFPDDLITYTVNYENKTDTNLSNVVITDTLIEAIEFEGDLTDGSYDEESRTITVEVGDLEREQSGNFSFTVKVREAEISLEGVSNQAKLTADDIDEHFSNVVRHGVDPIEIIKSGEDLNGGFLEVGDEILWRIEVRNTGIIPTTHVIITDEVASNMTYVPGSINGLGADDSADPQLVWDIGILEVNESETMSFKATINEGSEGTEVINQAVVDADQIDPTNSSNSLNPGSGNATVLGEIQKILPATGESKVAKIIFLLLALIGGIVGLIYARKYAKKINYKSDNPLFRRIGKK